MLIPFWTQDMDPSLPVEQEEGLVILLEDLWRVRPEGWEALIKSAIKGEFSHSALLPCNHATKSAKSTHLPLQCKLYNKLRAVGSLQLSDNVKKGLYRHEIHLAISTPDTIDDEEVIMYILQEFLNT